MKKIYLVAVQIEKGVQSNKFYTMTENGNGTFGVEYGRVGGNAPAVATYDMSLWDKKYNEKLKKGYKDVTEFKTVTKIAGSLSFDDIADVSVRNILKKLNDFCKHHVLANYTVSSEQVSQKMIDAAQEIIDTINAKIQSRTLGQTEGNQLLMKLYAIISRKMKLVNDYLIPGSMADKANQEWLAKTMMGEQSTLDAMAQQVAAQAQVAQVASGEISILESLNIGSMSEVTNASTIAKIKSMMGAEANKFHKAWAVVNFKTQAAFDAHVAKAANKKVELFWHGSRNENWLSLVKNGIMIRPAGAAYSGSMFGDGIYAANKFLKSYGYTSGRGSYWAKGNSDSAFLALYDFHVGNQKHIYRHDSSCRYLNEKDLKKEGFDSVYAHGGADLRNDEFIMYNSAQCTIKYLVEVKG